MLLVRIKIFENNFKFQVSKHLNYIDFLSVAQTEENVYSVLTLMI